MAENLNAEKPVSRTNFTHFVQRIRRDKADTDEARAKLGQTYSEVEEAGFNRAALKMALRLADMEATKRSVWLEDFSTYCDWLGVNSEPALPLTQPTEPAEDADAYTGGAVVDGTAQVDEAEREQIQADGKRAAIAGRPSSSNPFPPHSPLAPIWAKGWLDGEAENEAAAEGAAQGVKRRKKLKHPAFENASA